jgi:hypothetical protein
LFSYKKQPKIKESNKLGSDPHSYVKRAIEKNVTCYKALVSDLQFQDVFPLRGGQTAVSIAHSTGIEEQTAVSIKHSTGIEEIRIDPTEFVRNIVLANKKKKQGSRQAVMDIQESSEVVMDMQGSRKASMDMQGSSEAAWICREAVKQSWKCQEAVRQL